MQSREGIKNKKRIVIKIGTSSLTYPNGNLNFKQFEELATVLSGLQNEGKEVILVSSGSIAVGTKRMGLNKRPEHIAGKQAAAAVGQAELMKIYQRFFDPYHQIIAQILLTKDGLDEKKRRQNAENTLFELLKLGIIPIINENDTVATEEIEFGDNDTLAALVAKAVKADLLIMLSDIDGLYSADPNIDSNASLIPEIDDLAVVKQINVSGSASKFGTGGMHTKILAAEICMNNKIDAILTNGKNPKIIYQILEGRNIGTWFRG